MSARALRKLVLLLVVLVALYAVLTLVKGRAGPEGSAAAGPVARALETIQAAELESVALRGPAGESVVLERGTGGTTGAGGGIGWTANGFRADSATLERLLTAIGGATVGDRASTNSANHERLGVTADSGWQLTFAGAQGIEVVLLLGKPGPSFGSAYVRLPDQTDVFVVGGDLRSAAARPLDDWRDKTIARVDTAKVQALHVTRNGSSYSIHRADSAWTLVGSGARAEPAALADAVAVADLLGELANLRATGFFEEVREGRPGAGDAPDAGEQETPDDGEAEPEAPAEPEELRLIALGAAADTLLEITAEQRAAAYEIRTAGDSVLYQLPSWRVGRLMPPLDRIASTGPVH